METTSFRQLLESFCSNSPWSYAVFWKLQEFQDHQTLIIYEDGYYDYNVQQLRSRSILSQFSGQEDILNLGVVTDHLGGDVPECPTGLTSDVVSSNQYLLGQGLIGRVALSGTDLWLYSDEAESIELISYLEHHLDEWLLPVSAGIKTALIIPISSYGVLQLGSFEKVTENFANVADIKERIFSLMDTVLCAPPNFDETPNLWSSILVPEWDNKEELSCNPFHGSHVQSVEEFDAAEFTNFDISASYEVIDSFLMEDITTNSPLTSNMDISHMYLDLSTDSDTLIDFAVPDLPEVLENMWTFSCFEEQDVDAGISSESSSGASSYPLELEQQSPESENGGGSDHKTLANPNEYPDQTGAQEASEKTSSFKNEGCSSCSFEANVDFCNGMNLPGMSSCGWFDEGGDHDYLLEVAVSSLYKNTDDDICCIYNSSKSTVTSPAELVPSFQVKNSYETNDALTEYPTTVSHGRSTPISFHQGSVVNALVTSPASYESAKFKDEKPIGSENGFAHNNEKIPKHKKGRVGSKVNLRPRPRDRQLIQDRLKQLRKLVPSGTKSSIDGLLEQTTKHMMFLRSVTEQAKKVKQFNDQKIIADKNEATTNRPTRSKPSQQGGSNTESCPIIVTDMEHPGQFLIQMLCNGDEVFFEMIEVMRQLNLSILQGVMETHRNNWARFIVEASDDFNKLDIFWPLMRILQRNGDWMTNMNQWCT